MTSNRISISSMPTDSNVAYWRPTDAGQNLVVMLSQWDVDNPGANVVSSGKMVRGFKNAKFGKAYPMNFSYVSLDTKDDPRNVLAPELKNSFLAICYVGVKKEDVWQTCMWQVTSQALYKQLINLAASNDITGNVISISKAGNSAWSVIPAPKVKVDTEIVSELMNSVPPLDEIITKMNLFDTENEVWEYLIRCSNGEVNSKEELMTLFGVGNSAELL